MNLIRFKHPRSGELVCIDEADLGSGRDLIALYDADGTKRSRAQAWLGNGKASDIGREEAKAAIKDPKPMG